VRSTVFNFGKGEEREDEVAVKAALACETVEWAGKEKPLLPSCPLPSQFNESADPIFLSHDRE
jgi:hypothetical protein